MCSSSDKIRINRLHWPVTTLGYGQRIGIWFQGCSIQCKGCCSKDTWDDGDTKRISIDKILKWVRQQPIEKVDGITISGGEPFDQPDGLLQLTTQLRQIFSNTAKPVDILVYSGHPWKWISNQHHSVLEETDIVISEPYVAAKNTAWLRGSDNQEFHILSALGKERYSNRLTSRSMNPIQFQFENDKLWIIGIPERNDLDNLVKKLSHIGITLDDISWAR